MALLLETARVGAFSLSLRFQSSKQTRDFNVVGLHGKGSCSTATGFRLVTVRAAKEADVKGGDILPSGEWPESFSMLNYEDLSKHYERDLFKPEVSAWRSELSIVSF